jgi:hypothetical protein
MAMACPTGGKTDSSRKRRQVLLNRVRSNLLNKSVRKEICQPLLIQPIWSGQAFSNAWQAIILFFPLIGSALLLAKVSPRLSGLGQLPMPNGTTKSQ